MPPYKLKKGQIQMMETIMVLVILIIIGSIALTFYSGNAKEEFEKKIRETEQYSTIETAQTISKLPELKCSGDLKKFCFDKYKAKTLGEIMSSTEPEYKKSQEYYKEIIKNAKITIKTIYPEQEEIIIYDKPLPGNKTTKPLIIPTPLYDPIKDNKQFGLLIIEKYFKTIS